MNNTTPALVGANTTKKRVPSPAALAKRVLNTPINHCFFCNDVGGALDHATLGLGGAIICESCVIVAAEDIFARSQVLLDWEEEETRFAGHPRRIGRDAAGEELFTIAPATKRGGRTTFHHYELCDQEGFTIGHADDFNTLRRKAQRLVDGEILLNIIER